ncbi:helix-turn-helix transcriptional regulator [bacterium]|nr:helix-turn-helix transcriptional regulator [bacterium]
MSRINGALVWDEEFDKKHFTAEQIEESNLQAALICALVEARKEKGLSQQDLEAITGIKQSQIARVERCNANPSIKTVIKLLAAVGKTLAVVPLKNG